MAITMSTASLPIFISFLGNLHHCMCKAEAYAAKRGFDVNVLINARLAPDMLPFASQIRIACDAARIGVARMGGPATEPIEDNEATFAELKGRIEKTLAYLNAVPAGALDGLEDRDVTFPVGRDGTTRTVKAEAFLTARTLPNFFFHVTTAYNILRHNGVDVGKLDYLAAGKPA